MRSGSRYDVSEVDGEPVKDREDLRALLAKSDRVRLVKELTSRNARLPSAGSSGTSTSPRFRPAPRREADTADQFDRKRVTREDDVTLACWR
jgi:hypothetical protein